jgi:RNA polymerase sigma-70 factor (ECF subfamily)
MNSVPTSPTGSDTKAENPSAQAVDREAQRAFRAMVIEHAPHLQRVLRSLGVHGADLDDICQEVFIVAYRRLEGFEGRSSLRTWLCGIALRVASDYRSKAYRRRELPTAAPPVQAEGAQQEATLERKRAWQFIEGLVAELPNDQREVFVLYEIGELSMSEVALALGCPAPTAYSRLYAAREQVERRIATLRLQERVK